MKRKREQEKRILKNVQKYKEERESIDIERWYLRDMGEMAK